MSSAFSFRQWILIATVACANMLQIIDGSIVNVSIPQMMGSLGASLSDIGWVVTSYAVANIVMIALSSWFSARIGRKRYFVGSILFFTAASMACGVAGNVWTLVFFRFLQGLAGGGVAATGQSILIESFSKEDRPLANAIYGMTIVVGASLGPTLGGWITDHLSWNWVFFINLPMGLIATFLASSFVPHVEYGTKAPSMDWTGIVLLFAGIGSLQLVLERGHEMGWFESGAIAVLAATAVVSIVGFVRHALRSDAPVLNLRLLGKRTYAMGVFYAFIQGFGLFASNFLVPVFAQTILGFSATDTGLLMLPGAIATAFVMPVVGKKLRNGASPQLVAAGGFVLFFAFAQMLTTLTTQSGTGDFMWPLLVRGIGMGMLFVPLTTLAFIDLKGTEIPQGTALTNLVRQLGGSLGIALMATFVSHRTVFHRSILAEKVSEWGGEGAMRLKGMVGQFLYMGDSPNLANAKALGSIARAVGKQASLLSYLDAFQAVAILYLVLMALLWTFKTPAKIAAPLAAGSK